MQFAVAGNLPYTSFYYLRIIIINYNIYCMYIKSFIVLYFYFTLQGPIEKHKCDMGSLSKDYYYYLCKHFTVLFSNRIPL